MAGELYVNSRVARKYRELTRATFDSISRMQYALPPPLRDVELLPVNAKYDYDNESNDDYDDVDIDAPEIDEM